MARQLVFWDAQGAGREWLNEQASRHLILDPRETHPEFPGCCVLGRRDEILGWGFVGGPDVQQNPLELLRVSSRLIRSAPDNLLILAPRFDHGPVARSLRATLIDWLQPDSILISRGDTVNDRAWPMGVTEFDFPPGMPDVVLRAQRKARLRDLLERSKPLQISFQQVRWTGVRLGSGQAAPEIQVQEAGIRSVLHIETFGSTAFAVVSEELDALESSLVMRLVGATRLHFALNSAYSGLVCSLARIHGEDVSLGYIESIDFRKGVVSVRATAEDIAGLGLIRVGHLRIDSEGNELGTVKPWSL